MGRHPVLEAFQAGKTIEKVFFQKGMRGETAENIRLEAQKHGVSIQYVPVEKLNRLARGNHQGVIAMLSAVNYYSLEDILPAIYEKGEMPLIMILDGVSDVRNMGAIARTAWCSGVHALVVAGSHRAPMSADAVKASAGALNLIPVCRYRSVNQVMDILINNGIGIIAAHEQGNDMPDAIDFDQAVAIVMGDESTGISNQVIQKANHLVKIPMQRSFDSLNVSVAAGMLLYEVMKQRKIS